MKGVHVAIELGLLFGVGFAPVALFALESGLRRAQRHFGENEEAE
jgi:hypothetical protein